MIPVDLYGGFPDLVALEKLCDEHGIAADRGRRRGRRGSAMPAAPPARSGTRRRSASTARRRSRRVRAGWCCPTTGPARAHAVPPRPRRLPGDVSFRSVEVAWKYKMSELQAALGRVQLARIDELIDRKRQIFGWYADRLDGAPSPQRRARRRAGDVLDGHRRVRRAHRCDAGHGRDALAAPTSPPARSSRRSARSRRSPTRPTPHGPAARTRSATTWPLGHQPAVGADAHRRDVDRVCEVVGRFGATGSDRT